MDDKLFEEQGERVLGEVLRLPPLPPPAPMWAATERGSRKGTATKEGEGDPAAETGEADEPVSSGVTRFGLDC